MTIEIKVPDIGDFDAVPVIEVLVAPGDTVAVDDPLIVLESDKASMEVPSPQAGTVAALAVKVGDKVTKGSLVLTMEGEAAPDASTEPTVVSASSGSRPEGDVHGEIVVIGAGPGGYSAAFRAADLGKQVVMIDRWETLGGVCLNVGCIPSKALLHGAKVISEAEDMGGHGIKFSKPKVDLDALRSWKDGIVGKLTGGLVGLAKARKVTVVRGAARFIGPKVIEVEHEGSKQTVTFDQCIIAAGSEPVKLPFIPHDDPRVIDSTGALELDDIPKRMLVLGGGIIGMEMATVYEALGTKVTVVELMDQIIPGADKDIIKPLAARMEKRFEAIKLKTKVTAVEGQKKGLKVTFEGPDGETSDVFDKILVSVGRIPNGKLLDAEAAEVAVTDRGFIETDKQMRTNVPHIFAIGDVVGQPMLAHKAVHEGKVAAEVCAGHKSAFDAKVIPSVAYTDPEVAWVGMTETEAKARGVKVGKGVFPWAASGRALSMNADGMTKVLFDPETNHVIGAAIVGPSAGDLIAEVVLAIETGCDAEDVGLSIHPHPTLSETVAMAAEMFEGTITDLIPPKKRA